MVPLSQGAGDDPSPQNNPNISHIFSSRAAPSGPTRAFGGGCVLTGPSGCTHPHQVAHGDREADGQRRGAHAAAPVVRGCEDAGGQLEGEDDLHHEGLAWGYVVVELEP